MRARGFCAIAGVDEVGRGSLFGAVFAAAVILSPDRPVRGLNDSKQLEPERREVLAERIRERAAAWAIAAVDAAAIDRINIYQASRLAMRLAVEKLLPMAGFLLIVPVPLAVGLPPPLIHGDARCHAIAAAPSSPKSNATPACASGTKSIPNTAGAAQRIQHTGTCARPRTAWADAIASPQLRASAPGIFISSG